MALCASLLAWSCTRQQKTEEKSQPTAEAARVAKSPQTPVKVADDSTPAEPAKPTEPANAMPPRMKCLVESYPDHLCGGDATHVFWCNGDKMLWDDGKAKADHDTLLNTADLEDQLAQPYPLGADFPMPLPVNYEPGRVRNTAFFLKMYGETESAMRQTLTRINWLPSTDNRSIRVTKVNKVHEKLAAVSADIEKLSPALQKAAGDTSGPFYWRNIKGTERKSMHSFAIAFDIGLKDAYYWRWAKPDANGMRKYKNKMPIEIVEIFENHGFIWGGKWFHFDTPHFEYRPELLHPDCVAKKGDKPDGSGADAEGGRGDKK